jgi:hypothetical protein
MLPDAVHEHARGEGVFRIGDGLGEFEPAAVVMPFGTLLGVGREDFEEAPGNNVAFVILFSA